MRCVKLHNDRLQGLKGGKVPDGLKVCLVLGAKLRPDNSLSPILQLRVRLVSILANTYPDWLFYISGCRADTSVIYRTLVVTSSFHIARSVRIARWLGYDAWGIDISDYEKVKSNPYYWREQLAALRSLWLVFCIRTPLSRISTSFFHNRRLRRLRRNEQQFDAQNELILQRAMKNVDQSMPQHLIVSLSHVDCTTVMEDVLSLALCYRDGRTTLADLKDYYQRMHYQDGVVSFATRNHYFTWIMQSAIKEGFVERISPDEPAFPFTGLMDLQPSYMTRNKYLFRPHDGDILAVVCDQHTWARGVEVKHLLIAKWMDGRLHFYHASADGLGIANMDAYTYMKDKFTMIGVAVYRLKYDAA